MKRIALGAVLSLFFCTQVHAGLLYQQQPHPNGGFYRSSWWDPDGSNYDEYIWDKFVLPSGGDVDTVTWRGCYDPAYGGAGGPVVEFTVAIYGSIPGGSEPDMAHPPLVEYTAGGNAGETYAGVSGGVAMYDYRFPMPAAFHAAAGVPYWVQIEGWQWGFPDWSVSTGTGGDGSHYRCQHNNFDGGEGVPTGCWFTRPSGDAAFSLRTRALVGVDATPETTELALIGAFPNPSRGGRVAVSLSLPSAGPARLDLLEASGRLVRSELLSAQSAGRIVVDLAAKTPIHPGIYFARLSQGARSQQSKVIVIP